MKKKEKKVIIQHSESLEKFKTDLSEYAFILEQQYKKKEKIVKQKESKVIANLLSLLKIHDLFILHDYQEMLLIFH